MTAWLLLASSALAGCDQDLELAVQRVEARFALGDTAALQDAVDRAREALVCLEQPIAPGLAARLHRAEAVTAFTAGDLAQADVHLAGMVAADPLLRLDQLVPGDHTLERRLAVLEEHPGAPLVLLKEPAIGRLLVNGVEAAAAPPDRPWVFQHVDGGAVKRTSWVDVGAAAPPYQLPGGATPREREAKGLGWKVAGAGAGLAAGALYGAAWAGNAGYHRAVEDGDNAAIQSRHGLTTGLAIGSTAAAGASATLFVVGFTR